MTLTHKRLTVIITVGFAVALVMAFAGFLAAQRHVAINGFSPGDIANMMGIAGGLMIVASAALGRISARRALAIAALGLMIIWINLSNAASDRHGEIVHWLRLGSALAFGGELGLLFAYWIYRRSDAREAGRGGPEKR